MSQSFSDLGLHPDLARAVKELGWTQPTPIQTQAIPLGLEGKDILGGAQTGSGKTGAFLLPSLTHVLNDPKPGLRILVLVPTRELAAQVEEMFIALTKHTKLKSAVIIGGVGYDHQKRAVQNGATLAVATPGRLLDHLEHRAFTLDDVDHLILDEADRMLDMGFMPDIRAILRQVPPERQTLLFSATLAPEIERIASFAMKDPVRVEIARPTTVAEGISQVLYPISQSQKADFLMALLKSLEFKSVLIFTRTKSGADVLEAKLTRAGREVAVLHSNRTQSERTEAMEAFRHGRVKILVATDIAARGIDVKGVSHVINYDVPEHPEDYVHRVGRTARAYGVGDAITLMDPMHETQDITGIETFVGVKFPRAMLPDFPYLIPPKLTPTASKTPWESGWSRRHTQALRGRPRFRR
jgi:ATP-dependent RNA helicase RhlE